jgi:type II secretory pathway pseudopilin PulG
MSLVEVLVSIGLFGLVGSLLLGLAMSTSAVTEDTRARTGVTEEARTAMERMAREVRQASEIESVTLPSASSPLQPTSFTFWTDFDGDGLKSTNAADPEVMTYRWNPANQRLSLTAQTGATEETRPVLAAKVTSFVIELRSSSWEHDANGDGTTTWLELDGAGLPVGNGNGLPDAVELARVDLLAVTLTVEDGSGTQTYRTQIDLRNRT